MLTQTAAYALRALGFIAASNDESPVLARTIAEQLGIPQNYLSKIVNKLAHAGLLRSARGINGGFLLTKDPKDIRFIEVISLFMKPEDFKACLLGSHECNGSCSVHRKWAPIAQQMLRLLEETTIDELVNSGNRP